MTRRTDFRKAITYNGQVIQGLTTISYKIDGVRILYRDGKFVTRNNKVPPGLDIALTTEAKDKIREFKDCEVYKGNFFASNSPLSKHNPEVGCIGVDDIYTLDELDDRLYVDKMYFLMKNSTVVRIYLTKAIDKGYEGLVLRNDKHWYRVKPQSYADVYITGWFEQLDKNKNPKGCLGGFTTNYGNVTAFTKEKRDELWDNPEQYVGKLMCVRYKERYHTGNFRYAVTFQDFRTDKDTESFDTPPPLK